MIMPDQRYYHWTKIWKIQKAHYWYDLESSRNGIWSLNFAWFWPSRYFLAQFLLELGISEHNWLIVSRRNNTLEVTVGANTLKLLECEFINLFTSKSASWCNLHMVFLSCLFMTFPFMSLLIHLQIFFHSKFTWRLFPHMTSFHRIMPVIFIFNYCSWRVAMFNLQWTAWASSSWLHADTNRMMFIECGFEISPAGLHKARFQIK